MSGRAPVWRAIVWIERFLPTPADYSLQRGNGATGDARSSRRRLAILSIVSVAAVVPTLARDHTVFAGMWPMWRVQIETLLLVLAGVAAIAAVVSGVTTWRRERRDHA